METQEINNGERGASVRAKLNNLFRNIISGEQGINKLWNSITNLGQTISDNQRETEQALSTISQSLDQSQSTLTQQMSTLSAQVSSKVDEYKNGIFRNRGYFSNSNALIEAHPTDEKGAIAYVGENYPYAIWTYNGTQWVDSGETGGGEISLSEYVKFAVEQGEIVYLRNDEGEDLFPITKDTAIVITEEGDLLSKSGNLSDLADRETAMANLLASAQQNKKVLIVTNGVASWGTLETFIDGVTLVLDSTGVLRSGTHYIREGESRSVLTRDSLHIAMGDMYVDLGNYDVPDVTYGKDHEKFTIYLNNVAYTYKNTETSPGGSRANYVNGESVISLVASATATNRLYLPEEASSDYDLAVTIKMPTEEYVPLDERFIPLSIPRFSNLPTPDWSVGDSNNKNFIANRTHFENLVENISLETEGQSQVDFDWDIIPTAGKTYVVDMVVNGSPQTERVISNGASVGNITISTSNGAFLYAESRTFGSGNDGRWIGNPALSSISVKEVVELKQLDERFIPNNIARVSDISTPDWNENDVSSKGHILHRTHWVEATENKDYIVENVSLDTGRSHSVSIDVLSGDYYVVIDGEAPQKFGITSQGIGGRTYQWIGTLQKFGIGGQPDVPSKYWCLQGIQETMATFGCTLFNRTGASHTFTIYKKSNNVEYHKLDNKYLNLDQTYNAQSENAQSGKAVAQALGAVNELIPNGTATNNKLVNNSQLTDAMSQNLAEYVASDSSMVVPFMHSTQVGDSRGNLEQGPWYKGGQQCGQASGVYVTRNDYAVVLEDESVCYCEAHGYRYQRQKDGGASQFGYVILPDGSTTLIRVVDDPNSPYNHNLYFVDNSHVFSTDNLYFIVTSLNVLVDSVVEMANGIGGTILNRYDLHFPTTRYSCVQSQTADMAPIWSFQFFVNDETLTGAQIAALNSGITKQLVDKILANELAIQGKQDALSYSDNIIEDEQGHINLNNAISVEEIHNEGPLDLVAKVYSQDGVLGLPGQMNFTAQNGRAQGGILNFLSQAAGTINIKVAGGQLAGDITIENGAQSGTGGTISILSKGTMTAKGSNIAQLLTENNSFVISDAENCARYSEILKLFTDYQSNYSEISAMKSARNSGSPTRLKLQTLPDAQGNPGSDLDIIANCGVGSGGNVSITAKSTERAGGGTVNVTAEGTGNGSADNGRVYISAKGGAAGGYVYITAEDGTMNKNSWINLDALTLYHRNKTLADKKDLVTIQPNGTIVPDEMVEVNSTSELSTLPTLADGVGSYCEWSIKIPIANGVTLWSSVTMPDGNSVPLTWLGDCTNGVTDSAGTYLISIGSEGIGVIVKVS